MKYAHKSPISNMIEWWKRYPDKFAEEVLGVKLYWYQVFFLRAFFNGEKKKENIYHE